MLVVTTQPEMLTSEPSSTPIAATALVWTAVGGLSGGVMYACLALS